MKITITCFDMAMNRLWKRSGNFKKNQFEYHIAPFPLSIFEKPFIIKNISLDVGYVKRKQNGPPLGGITTEVEVMFDGINYKQIKFAQYSKPSHVIEYEDSIKAGFMAKEIAMTKPGDLLKVLTEGFIVILLIGVIVMLSQIGTAISHWQQPINKTANIAYAACMSVINQTGYIAQLDNTTLAYCKSKT